MTRTWRGAVVGIGAVARNAHLPGWLACPEVEIAALYDPDVFCRVWADENLPAAKWCGSLRELLATPHLDFVDVCAPPASHRSIVAEALEAGVHVLCEKPLVSSVADFDLLTALADRKKRCLFTVHNWKHAEAVRRASKAIRTGFPGEERTCRWETIRTRPAGSTTDRASWRTEAAAAEGGILLDHGWHSFYIVEEWLGGGPYSVRARFECRAKDSKASGVEDTVRLELKGSEGRAEIFLTWAGTERKNTFVISGERGRISACNDEWILEDFSRNERIRETLADDLAGDSYHRKWFPGVIREFLSAMEGEGSRERNREEARFCVSVLEAARLSHQRGGEWITRHRARTSASS